MFKRTTTLAQDNKLAKLFEIKNTVKTLITPADLKQEFSLPLQTQRFIKQSRKDIIDITKGEDDRLLVIVGPCSIHDPIAALEYAKKLQVLQKEYQHELLMVMRVFLEKPRTTIGWKGLINNPSLDDTFNVNQGLKISRKLLIDINQLGLPVATEFLSTLFPAYTQDLISWAAIGARTTESQVHRELASSVDFTVGFKNNTDGNVQVAIDAMVSAKHSHVLLVPDQNGQLSTCQSLGNPNSHLILRGGIEPNYRDNDISQSVKKLNYAKAHTKLMVDCSHSNSQKDHLNQSLVADHISQRIADGAVDVFGVMLESFLVEGRQNLQDVENLTYGQSITDACINLKQSQEIFSTLANAVIKRRSNNKSYLVS
ncbi:3-deoxy-7-phosphoheptulonate synthase [Colwellia sp. 1_MG-2023]|uniref:3-deoxy-7-phosphoheptulonate synthase n=1 Tax=Colwellia sp. 1_MG-2023 TaxID=3062649 RepID=UPI0026E46062|nr:3-deoxy-7-phosphoheptulonate synthase [Colwellia sp. 1_MG-2023]MDO6444380.1 3-deoxy-7-phosphoheptulonate synthase [Colwellia sp. 1_MG-2023]